MVVDEVILSMPFCPERDARDAQTPKVDIRVLAHSIPPADRPHRVPLLAGTWLVPNSYTSCVGLRFKSLKEGI